MGTQRHGCVGAVQELLGGTQQVEELRVGEGVERLAAVGPPNDEAAVARAGQVGGDGGLGRPSAPTRSATRASPLASCCRIASRVGSAKPRNNATAGCRLAGDRDHQDRA